MLHVYPVAAKSESVPGGFPRIAILFKIEEYLKNNHRHIVDIPRIIFLGMTKSLGKRAFSESLQRDIPGYEGQEGHLILLVEVLFYFKTD